MQKTTDGWLSGLLGVIIFSGSLPATRIAVQGFDPLFLTFARATIAGALGLLLLVVLKQRRPTRAEAVSLAIVALGVVIGFPLLTALALKHVTSAHAIVFVGLLPLATALFGVWRGGERPRLPFWIFSIIGSGAVAAFALRNGGQAVGGRRCADAGRDRRVRAGLRGRRSPVARFRRLAGDLVGARTVAAADAAAHVVHLLVSFDGVDAAALWGRVRVAVQHADRLRVLVSRACARRDRRGQLQLLQPFFGLLLAAGCCTRRCRRRWSR